MSGARLRRVCHEANIPRSQVDSGVDHDSKNDRNNKLGANNSEIMFDSMLVGPLHFRVAKGTSAETWYACVLVFKD